MTSPIAPWLAAVIETTTGAPVGARNARPRRCQCGAVTLVGLDDDVCALSVIVDPYPLDAAGELAAALTGRTTYRARGVTTPSGQRVQLTRRDRFSMRRPPGTPDDLGQPVCVLAEHRCGLPLGSPVQAVTGPPSALHDDACPY